MWVTWTSRRSKSSSKRMRQSPTRRRAAFGSPRRRTVSRPRGSTAMRSSSALSRSRSDRGARRTTFRALEEIETVQLGTQLRESQVSPAADLRSTPLDAPEFARAGFGARQEIEAERFADELGAGTVFTLSDLLKRARDGRRERDGEGGRRTHRKRNRKEDARTSISITQSYFILGARHLSRAQPTNAVAVGQRVADAFDRNAKSQPGGGRRDPVAYRPIARPVRR